MEDIMTDDINLSKLFKYFKNKINDNKCGYVYPSGSNMGMRCCRRKCPYHKSMIVTQTLVKNYIECLLDNPKLLEKLLTTLLQEIFSDSDVYLARDQVYDICEEILFLAQDSMTYE